MTRRLAAPIAARLLPFALLAWLHPGEARALQCMQNHEEMAFDAADLVFIGEATLVGPSNDGITPTTLSVIDPRKGKMGPSVAVLSMGFKGGFRFEKGKRYVVFARRDEKGFFQIHDCGGTTEMAHAARILALIQGKPRTAALTSAQPAPPPPSPPPAAFSAPPAASGPAPAAPGAGPAGGPRSRPPEGLADEPPGPAPGASAGGAPGAPAGASGPPPAPHGGCGSCSQGAPLQGPAGGLALALAAAAWLRRRPG